MSSLRVVMSPRHIGDHFRSRFVPFISNYRLTYEVVDLGPFVTGFTDITMDRFWGHARSIVELTWRSGVPH